MSSTRREAERLLAEFFAQRDAGAEVDFDALCAEHPDLAPELRQMTWREPDSPAFSFFRKRLSDTSTIARGARARAGDRIGDFRLVELLDEGGQGEVWIAEQLTLDRRVALKLIRPERAGSKTLAMFAREARAGGRLSHPNIVTVYDHGVSGGHAWIAMELVDGACTLRDSMDELADTRRLPSRYYQRAADLIAQVADALQAAHEHRVIHRDVKPRNILITSDDRPKVTDFGLARITDEGAISRTGDFAGTYAYMSPEQVAAKRAGIDHRTDVFSLGVVAYELLCLHRPFEGETSREIAEAILTAEPQDLHRLDPRIPKDLATITRKALEKNRGERYQTMAELAADLRRFLADEPILARPPRITQRAGRWARRHRTGVAVSLTLLAVAAVVRSTTRAAPPAPPFTDESYEHLLVDATEADERSPTFIGQEYLVFERREAGGPGRLWCTDLSSDLTARPWSPEGEDWRAPSVSPDGRWLAYETVTGSEPRSRAIELRRIEHGGEGPRWSPEVHRRIDPGVASHPSDVPTVERVRWSGESDRFLYTRSFRDSSVLMLHTLDGPGQDLEVLRRPRGSDPIHATFSPEGNRILVGETRQLTTVSLNDDGRFVQESHAMDCGDYRDPLWLDDDSLLFGQQTFLEASTRLYHRAAGRSVRLSALESTLIGAYFDLSLSPDRSLLALAARVDTSTLVLAGPEDATGREVATRFPPNQPTFAPDGRIVHAADTADRARLFVFDPAGGAEERIDLDVAGLPVPWNQLHLDQPSFSQNGTRLALRAKIDPVNGRCDSREWIVISSWPPFPGSAQAVEMNERITFPNVDDEGRRVAWIAPNRDGTLFTGILQDQHITGTLQLRTKLQWPCAPQLTGDGNWIAVRTADYQIALLRTDATEEVLLARHGKDSVPRWIPGTSGEDLQLMYLNWSPADPERWTLRSVALDAPEDSIALRSIAVPYQLPRIAAIDPVAGAIAYTLTVQRGGDIWLARPKAFRRLP